MALTAIEINNAKASDKPSKLTDYLHLAKILGQFFRDYFGASCKTPRVIKST